MSYIFIVVLFVLYTSPLSDTLLAKFFSHLKSCLFTAGCVPQRTKFKKFWWVSICPFLLSLSLLLVSYLRNYHLIQSHKNLPLCFRLRVSRFRLWSSGSQSILVMWGMGSTSFFSMGVSSCPKTISWKVCSSLIKLLWHLCWKSINHKYLDSQFYFITLYATIHCLHLSSFVWEGTF